MEKKRTIILLAIAAMFIFGGCGKDATKESESTKNESPTTTYTVVDDSEIQPDSETMEMPLEVTFKSKEYEEYETVSDLCFYFNIKNTSSNNLTSPLLGADLLDSDGNIVSSQGFTHMGVLTPNQQFEGTLYLDSDASGWDKREDISAIRLVSYAEGDSDLIPLDNPITVPIT